MIEQATTSGTSRRTSPSGGVQPAKSRGKILPKVGLLLASTCAVLLLAEIGIRMAGLDRPLVWEPDPELGWRHLPGAAMHWTEEGDGHVLINSLGYRDRERQVAKPAGVFRIAVIGDSMTEAVQVNLDQTFTYSLEESLQRKGVAVEVLNFGVNGYGPIQELLLLQREVRRYQPDLVVLAIFLDNDVADGHRELASDTNGCPPFLRADENELRFDTALTERSHAAYHAEPFYSLRKYSASYRLASYVKNRRYAQAVASNSASKQIPKRYGLYRTSLSPEWQEAWATLERVLRTFAAEAQDQNARFMLLSLPAGQVINPSAWQSVLERHPGMGEVEWDLDGPDRRLHGFAQARGWALLQPSADFRAAGSVPPLHIGNVGHLTAEGHSLVARLLEGELRHQRLGPAPAAHGGQPVP